MVRGVINLSYHDAPMAAATMIIHTNAEEKNQPLQESSSALTCTKKQNLTVSISAVGSHKEPACQSLSDYCLIVVRREMVKN